MGMLKTKQSKQRKKCGVSTIITDDNKMKLKLLKTKLLVILLQCMTTSFVFSQGLSLPYYTGFDNAGEQAGWQGYVLGVNGTYGPWGFSAGTISHDYNTTGTVEDWFISPALNFTSQSKISLKIRVFVISGSINPTDYIGIWHSSGSQDPNIGSYTEVVNLTSIASSNFNQWIDTTVSLPFTVGTGYIGFKYMNVNNWFTIDIDSVTVAPTSTTDISDTGSETDILLYPNPTTGHFTIELTPTINSIEIYNLLGEKVKTLNNIAARNITLQRDNLSSGLYIVRLKQDNKIILTKKLVITDK